MNIPLGLHHGDLASLCLLLEAGALYYRRHGSATGLDLLLRAGLMERFEYAVTRHAAEMFSKLVYFCSADADCDMEQVPAEEPRVLVELLNGRGEEGWELIQVFFRKDGLVAFWKRKIVSS